MAFRFGTRSCSNLATCDDRLVAICELALAGYAPTVTPVDFAVIEGHRDRETQDDLYRQGLTRARWPRSAHSAVPSEAVHVIPWPFAQSDWESIPRWHELATHMLGAAAALGIPLLWGGHWKWLRDYAHFELIDG